MKKPGGGDAAELRKKAADMSDDAPKWNLELAQDLAQFIVTWEKEHHRKRGLQ